MNIDISKLLPGTFGVSHGGGVAGELIRHATESWAGHAFLYLGNGQLVEGTPPVARVAPADSHADAIWAYRMWDQLKGNRPGALVGRGNRQSAGRRDGARARAGRLRV